MQRTKLNFDKFDWANLPKLAAVSPPFGRVLSYAVRWRSNKGQKTFSSAEDASNALVAGSAE